MRKNIVAILFLLFLIFLFFSREIFSHDHIFAPVDTAYLFSPWNEYKQMIPHNFQQGDAFYQFIPWRTYAYTQLKKDTFPFWNPYEYGGIPFFANDQSGVLSIYNILTLILPFYKGFLVADILKLIISAIGMYIFLSLFSLSTSSRIFGSIAFTFSALMVTWLFHPVSAAVSFMPLLFWSYERLFRSIFYEEGKDSTTKNSIQLFQNRYSLSVSIFLTSFIIALSFLCGHSETTVNVLIATTIYFFTKIVIQHKKILLSMFILTVTPLLGFLLASMHTLPFLQLLLNSVTFINRSLMSSYTVEAKKLYLPMYSLVVWLVPNIIGNSSFSYLFGRIPVGLHEAIPYIGVTPFFLGISTIGKIKSFYKTILPLWMVVFLGFGMAYGLPVIKQLTMLPILRAGGAFRYTILMEFGLSALSAFGFDMLLGYTRSTTNNTRDHISNRDKTIRYTLVPGIIIFIICLIAWLLYWLTRYDIGAITGIFKDTNLNISLYWLNEQTLPFALIQVLLSLLFMIGSLWLLIKSHKGHINQRIASVGLIVLTITDLFIYGVGYNPDVPASEFYPDTPLISKLKELDLKHYSFYAPDEIMPPDTATVYQIRDFRGYDMIASMRYQNMLYLMFPEEHPDVGESGAISWPMYPSFVIAGISGVKYFIFPRTFNPDNKYLKLIHTYGNLSLWDNTLAKPIFYLASEVIPADDDSMALQMLSRATYEDMNNTIVEGYIARQVFKPDRIKLTQIEQKPGRYVFYVQANTEGFLVLNEPFYPGWHAFINKKAVTIYHTNYLFQGINLQKGNYVVSFEYKPGIFFTGLKISIILFLVMFVTCISISLNRHHFRSNQKSE